MKKITKSQQPEFYEKFIRKKKPVNWDETNDIRPELRLCILEEQVYQCAYTEVQLKNDTSICHIDHFKKKDSNFFPKEEFDYSNLFVSTNNENFGAIFKDRNIKKEDYDLLINPTEEDPQKHFKYSMEGIISAAEDSKKAQKTIELFNLNAAVLRHRRHCIIWDIESLKKEYSLEEILSHIHEFEGMIRSLYNIN